MTKWRVGAIGPTELMIHPAVLIFSLYSLAIGHGMFFLIAAISILLHEAAHAGVAALLGAAPQSLELTPVGAVMRLQDERQLRSWQRGLMLLSGPLATWAICCLALWQPAGGMIPDNLRWMIFTGNLAILILNLLPVLPLDGGRLLTLLLEYFLPQIAADRVMRSLGYLAGTGLILLNIWCSAALGGWNLSLAFAGCCILYSANASTLTRAMDELRSFMNRKIMLENRGVVRTVTLTVLSTVTLRQIVRKLPGRRMIEVCCLQPGSQRVLGRLTEPELIEHYLNAPGAAIGDCVAPQGKD